MTRQPRAFFALDLGSATTSAAIVGHLGGRWRLVAHLAVPAGSDTDALLAYLVDDLVRSDAALVGELDGEGTDGVRDAAAIVASWPRIQSRSTPRRTIAVLACTRRARRSLEGVALRAGWGVVGGSLDEEDAFYLSRLVLDPRTDAVLLGADDPPAGDERRHLGQIASLVAAAARRRPELEVVLAGGAASHAAVFDEIGLGRREARHHGPGLPALPGIHHGGRDTRPADAAARADQIAGVHPPAAGTGGDSSAVPEPGSEPEAGPGPRPAEFQGAPSAGPQRDVLLAPEPGRGQPPGAALRHVLEALRAREDDSRVAIARSTASLAFVLDRTVEVIEVGIEAGVRCRAEPLPGSGRGSVAASHATVVTASIAPLDPSDAVVDDVLSWSTVPLDRYRLADRLRDLRSASWAEVDGDGALLRLAAARSAVGRLVEATPELSARPAPDLLVAAGGVWAAVPPPVVGLVLADLVRRAGASQLAVDAARLLGPLGTIEDETERRRVLADLADDLLVPLGTVIMPSSLRPGRSAGRLIVREGATPAARGAATSNTAAGTGSGVAPSGPDAARRRRPAGDGAAAGGSAEQPPGRELVSLDLEPGGIEVVDLPPGQTAIAELDFRDTVRLGARGRHFATEVTGGLGGLLVDLRDVPLRLPERAEARRSLLEVWQRALWPEIDR